MTVMEHPKNSQNELVQNLYQKDLDRAEAIKEAIRTQLQSKTSFSLIAVKEIKKTLGDK